MKKWTGKKFLPVMLISALLLGTCSIALAADKEDNATGRGLKSYGKITYRNDGDAVVIDSADFYTLADRIDLFKRGVAGQLNSMNTYFTTEAGISLQTDADIHVVHTKPSEADTVDPLKVEFDTLLEGIAASQSVPAGVTAATADNLSEGTAAWVDGNLILGTGADNQSHYDEGKKDSVQKIVFSLYNNKTEKYSLPAKRAYVSTHESSNHTKNDSFTYTSDPIYLYQNKEGAAAALNTISFVRSFSQYHGSGHNCQCRLEGNIKAELYLDNGTRIFSDTYSLGHGGSGSQNTTINLFDYNLGDSAYCYLKVTGAVSLKSDSHSFAGEDPFSQISMKFDNAYVSHIPIDIN